MQDQDLHIIVKESMELIAPEYNPAHWELMKAKLDRELPPPSNGLEFWKLFGLGLILVTSIAGYFLLGSETNTPQDQIKASVPLTTEKPQKTLLTTPNATKPFALKSDLKEVANSVVHNINNSPEQLIYQQASRHKRPPLGSKQLALGSIQSINMSYGKSTPLNLPETMSEPVTKVQLFYTDHPKDFEHQKLNTRRIKELIKLYPELSKNQDITWELVAQEITGDGLEAIEKFHGFLIHSLPKSVNQNRQVEPVASIFKPSSTKVNHSMDTYMLEQSIIKQVRDRIIVGDSTTFKVLERNKSNWKNVAVVCDWSSSMFPYGTQVFTWLSLNQ
ncbi:MAG: hypothetical protein ACR2MX_07015, partial [Cyclobacteriaceae bacterium]